MKNWTTFSKRAGLWAAVLSLLGGAIGSSLFANAARNAGGTYTLPNPAGSGSNPVVSGTTIASSWANVTLGDLAAEMSDSLDRSGKGAMLAHLQLFDGTVGAPGLTFGSDTSSGLYRIGANDYGFSVGGVKRQEWSTSGITFSLPLLSPTSTDLTADCGGGSCNINIGTANATFVNIGQAGGDVILQGGQTSVVALTGSGNFTTTGTYHSSATSGNQFACTGAAQCNFWAASAQRGSFDCGGGTCNADLGAANATTTTVGRSGQTTSINGNVTFGTAGPNLGGTTTGSWTAYTSATNVNATNYGVFVPSATTTNSKFRQMGLTVVGVIGSTGGGTQFTVSIFDVTSSSTVCTSSAINCTLALNTPTAIGDCNSALTSGHVYAIRLASVAAGCGTQPTGIEVTTEIAH